MKILLLRGGALGDLILTFPALAALRARFPESFILLLGTFPQASLASPQWVDEVCDLNGARFLSLFGSGPGLERLRTGLEGFDLALSYLSDPKRQIEKNLLSLGLNQFLTGPHLFEGDQHAARQLFQPLERLDLSWPATPPILQTPGSPPPVSGRLALHLGSGSKSKNWPVQSWVQLLSRLHFSEVLIIAGEADQEQLELFQRSYRSPWMHILKSQPLLELRNMLATCELFLGHDSGISHLAAALGVPTVALFGSTDPAIWSPLGSHVTTIRSPDHRMTTLSVARVLKAIATKNLASGKSWPMPDNHEP